MKRIGGLVLTMLLLALSIADVAAFDGKRKGFVLGAGLGPGLASFTQEIEGFEESDRENKLALATSFKIGGGINDQITLYWLQNNTWFSIRNVFDESVTIANGIGGVQLSYYLEMAAPSLYFSGGVGIATWALPFESDTSTWTGFGIQGGLGYEFSKYWSVEATLGWGQPKQSESGVDATTKAISFLVTISVLGY